MRQLFLFGPLIGLPGLREPSGRQEHRAIAAPIPLLSPSYQNASILNFHSQELGEGRGFTDNNLGLRESPDC